MERYQLLLAAVRRVLPEVLLVTEPVGQKLRRPCAVVLADGFSLTKEMGRRYRVGESFTVRYFPKEGERAEQNWSRLLAAVAEPAAGVRGKPSAKCEKDGFFCEVRYSHIAFLTAEDVEKMQKYNMTIVL